MLIEVMSLFFYTPQNYQHNLSLPHTCCPSDVFLYIIVFPLFSFVNNATNIKIKEENQEFDNKVLISENSKFWRKRFVICANVLLLMWQMTKKKKANRFQYWLKMPFIRTNLFFFFFSCLILAFCFFEFGQKKKGIILSSNLDNSSKIQQSSLIVVIVVNMTASYI